MLLPASPRLLATSVAVLLLAGLPQAGCAAADADDASASENDLTKRTLPLRAFDTPDGKSFVLEGGPFVFAIPKDATTWPDTKIAVRNESTFRIALSQTEGAAFWVEPGKSARVPVEPGRLKVSLFDGTRAQYFDVKGDRPRGVVAGQEHGFSLVGKDTTGASITVRIEPLSGSTACRDGVDCDAACTAEVESRSSVRFARDEGEQGPGSAYSRCHVYWRYPSWDGTDRGRLTLMAHTTLLGSPGEYADVHLGGDWPTKPATVKGYAVYGSLGPPAFDVDFEASFP